MDIFETIATRRSIRIFADEQPVISEEIIKKLLQAAMSAPSAGNQQPWHFIVVTDRERLDAIPAFHPYCKMITGVRTAIVICGDPDGKKWPAFWPQDCSAATQNLLLAARACGLGSVWSGVYPDENRMAGCRKLFGIPEHIYPFAVVPLGTPKNDFSKIDRYNESYVHAESW